jgi:hypothetical protein
MILGHVRVTRSSVDTHQDSYLLDQLTVVSVRRPLLGSALILGGGLGAFTFGFSDLLYPGELAALATIVTLSLLGGWQFGQLRLLSRDLRGSELSGAVFGSYAHLNRLRRDIAQAVQASKSGDQP